MKRTKLEDRQLPIYTKGEELVNMLTHILGIILGICVLLLGVIKSMASKNAYAITSSVVFGVSMILLYTVSTLYHGWEDEYQKKLLQILDHCTIYILITGTFIPICITHLREKYPVIAWVLFAIVCISTVIGIVFTAIDIKKYRAFSMVGYLSPWFLLFIIKQLIDTYTMAFVWYLIAGGVAYTIGAICYGLGTGKIKYMHSVFHIFILIGSIVHFIGIFNYCL